MVSESNLSTRLCPTFLRITFDHTGIMPAAAILTVYQDDGRIQSHGWSAQPGLESIIQTIQSSRDLKPVSKAKQHSGDFTVTRQPVQPYFEGTLTPLQEAERALLEKNGYPIGESYYFAIPYPAAAGPQGLFFLFAKNSDEALVMEKKMLELQNAIREVSTIA
jgi:hypothetical protein